MNKTTVILLSITANFLISGVDARATNAPLDPNNCTTIHLQSDSGSYSYWFVPCGTKNAQKDRTTATGSVPNGEATVSVVTGTLFELGKSSRYKDVIMQVTRELGVNCKQNQCRVAQP